MYTKQPEKMVYRKAVKIVKVKIGLEADNKKLLPDLPFSAEVSSLLTDFHKVEEISISSNLDGYIKIEDNEEKDFKIKYKKEGIHLSGPVSHFKKKSSDPRYSLWGNQGLLYRYTLYLLEKKYSIYSFHACSLYQEEKDRLFIIAGGAGSGKTAFLLKGLLSGLKLFSTETTHFSVSSNEIKWFKGSLIDNVRLETLYSHFPDFISPSLDFQIQISGKKAVELSAYQAEFDLKTDFSSIYIIFPRIEEGRKGCLYHPLEEKTCKRILFENISQKLAETYLLFEYIPLLGLDEEDMAKRRLKAVSKLLSSSVETKCFSVISNPEECWGNFLN